MRAAMSACEGPRSRSSVAIASAKRSTTPCVANGLVRPSRPARSPPRTQRSAKASASKAARSIFETGARFDAELHRGRAIEPDPNRMRRLPFALTDKSALFACGAAPVDSRRRLARKKGAELPERLARARAPPAMNPVAHRLSHAPGRDDQTRQTGGERRGFATDGDRERHGARSRRVIGSFWPQAVRSPQKSSHPRPVQQSSTPCDA